MDSLGSSALSRGVPILLLDWNRAYPDGDLAEAIARRALAQERSFLDAMADSRNVRMANRVFASGGFHFDEMPEEAAVEAAMERFNAASFEERAGPDPRPRSAGIDEPPELDLPSLPVRTVPTDEDLSALADEHPSERRSHGRTRHHDRSSRLALPRYGRHGHADDVPRTSWSKRDRTLPRNVRVGLVMFWAVERDIVTRVFGSGPPAEFDEADGEEMARIRS